MSSSFFFRKGLPLLFRTAENPHASVGHWILGTAGLVVGMIHVGGVTRLTQSGLSMTTWSPLGSWPPRSEQEWQTEFERYQTFPEWQQRQSMTLPEFQFIYAWEYGHRMLGRFVGVVFLVPWAYFSARGRIPAGYQGPMGLLAGMGATQGVVGWWMVRSGLEESRRGETSEIRVKPLRLATHLSMAVATYGALTWTGLNLLSLPHHQSIQLSQLEAKFPHAFRHAFMLRRGGVALTGLTALTIVSGALVAGNDAGRAYNTFPRMDGQWIPDAMLELVPWHRNLYENTATVQWNHRVLGTTTALTALGVLGMGLLENKTLTPQARHALYGVGVAATSQFALGVTALLSYVPLSLAAAHQLGSIAVFTSGIYLVHTLRYARPSVLRAAAKAVPKQVPSS